MGSFALTKYHSGNILLNIKGNVKQPIFDISRIFGQYFNFSIYKSKIEVNIIE